MPSPETFSISPIRDFVRKYLADSAISIDPFARNTRWATFTNDLSPDTEAKYHLDAEVFLAHMHEEGVVADLGLFDPPYSARQVSEVYQSVGREVGMVGTQCGALYKRVRNALDPLISPGGVVLSFGWDSTGMGINRGYQIEEILLVAHGGAHYDTICVAERKKTPA